MIIISDTFINKWNMLPIRTESEADLITKLTFNSRPATQRSNVVEMLSLSHNAQTVEAKLT